MKITPAPGGGQDFGSINTGRTSPDRIAAAKAIAAGEQPIRITQSDTPTDPQVARIEEKKKIKMRTQVSPDRIEEHLEVQPEETSNTENVNVDTTQEPEVIKPLSPQFAAIARQKRALQVKERELADREAKLQSMTSTDGKSQEVMERIKANPLGVLNEAGVSYDDLTQAILSSQDGNQEYLAKIRALESKIESLEKGFDTKLTDRDTQAKQQALNEMRKEAEAITARADTFKHVKAMKLVPKAIELIERTYDTSGEIIDVQEALSLIEVEAKKEYEALSRQLTPAQEQMLAVSQQREPQMRTLTNRDGARVQMSRRQRAIAAMNGTLKR